MSTNRLLLTYEPPEQRTRAIEWVLLRWTLLHGQDHLLFGELERKGHRRAREVEIASGVQEQPASVQQLEILGRAAQGWDFLVS